MFPEGPNCVVKAFSSEKYTGNLHLYCKVLLSLLMTPFNFKALVRGMFTDGGLIKEFFISG